MASDGQSPNVLNGTIPDTLANCSSLTFLRLSYANLTGPIPAWLGSLKELKVLDLASNRLTGTIPPSLGNLTGLVVLSLMDNADLQGEVPAELRLCSNLMSLSLGMTFAGPRDDRNQINGTLGSLYGVVLSNMTFLQQLVVSGTRVTGVIPQELGTGLKGLVHLDLWANFLEGEVPLTLGNLSNLEYVDLTHNDFQGSIPRELGFCTHLQEFHVGKSSDLGLTSPEGGGAYVHNDMMVGSIPQELWRLPFLRIFYVSYTSLGGEIPDFTNSSALVDVFLAYNELEGSIPTQLPPSLESFSVLFNRLIGPIPRAIGNLSNLLYVDILYDDIEGAIPSEIASCRKLQYLALGGSSISHGPRRSIITGLIPEELGQLRDLQFFELMSTQVSGMIPSSLGNCSSMIQLLLNNNDLGGLPTWLANMTSLQAFSGMSNRFQGLLSAVEWNRLQSLEYLILSRNNFSGYLPGSLGMASKLAVFMASEANLVGTIPLSFRNCSTLSLVDLQNNQLSGDRSKALDVLSDTADGRSIRAILLSSNKLEGSLPPWMGSRFKSLSILVLAGNLIEDSIPSSLSLLPSLQHVMLSDPWNVIFRVADQLTDPPIFLDQLQTN